MQGTLPILVATVALLLGGAGFVARLRRRVVLGRRMVGAALVLAISGVFVRGGLGVPESDVAVYLVDVSRSLGPDVGELLDPLTWPTEALGDRAFDRHIVLAFGAEVLVLHDAAAPPLTLAPGVAGRPAFRATGRLDLALAGAAAALRPGERGHLLLLTDGGLDLGDVRALPGSFRAAYVREPAPRRAENAGVRIVAAPSSLRRGERPSIEIEVTAETATARRMTVGLDGGEAVEVEATPFIRTIRTTLRAAADGDIVARLQGERPWDRDPEDDVDRTAIRRDDEPLRLGIMSGSAEVAARLEAALANSPVLAVRRLEIGAFRADAFDVLLLVDVDGGALGPVQSEEIRRFVAAGGGILLAGAEAAFSAGAWQGTALDDVSPLAADPGDRPIRLTVCLDRSGSMEASGRLEAAKRAVTALYERLGPRDELIVLAFSSTVDEVRRQGGGDPADLERELARFAPQGGTDLGVVLGRALAEKAPADKSAPVLLLTDGRMRADDAFARDGAHFAALGAAAKKSVHVFWFDREPEFKPPLERLARATGGSLVEIDDFRALVRPFLTAARPDRVVQPAPIAAPGREPVTLRRLLRTRKKERVDVLWAIDDQTVALARWNYGAGRAAAAPVDLDSRALESLFFEPGGFAAFLSALGEASRVSAGRLEEVANDGGYRLQLTTPEVSKSTRLLARVVDPGIVLDRIGPGLFASATTGEPRFAGFAGDRVAIVEDGRVKGQAVLFASDLSDRRPAPDPARLQAIERSLSPSGAATNGASGGPAILFGAAALLLAIDLAFRGKRR